MFRKSLQTITWGDPQHHLFDHIFTVARNAGYDAVEIGFRRLGQVEVAKAARLLDKHELQLSACHIGGNLADIAQAADERTSLERVLGYLKGLGSRYLIYSGLNIDASALDKEITHLAEISARCADRGITLLYHNHDWEFRDDRRIWRRLLDARIDTLGFAPDLGWAVKGGHGMQALLDEVGSNVRVLHFKDFITWEDGQNTCHLGTGVVDFAPAWAWLAEQAGADIWLTAEQDNAPDNDRACAVNGQYLVSHLDRLGH
ncbi:MAG: sugar phosphate isomerase/epimerase [Silicimonas sp.]|nr:sugar phosphate isomerase/epimerase [Silicimonas sp.]